MARIVLLLSIAALVLDSIFRYPGGSLDQSSQHRYDPLAVRFTAKTESIVNRIGYPQNIMNRCKFKGRPSSNFKESILVLEALFTIAFRNVQWN